LLAAFGPSPTQVLPLAHGPGRDDVQAGAVAADARQNLKIASSIRHHRRDVRLELLVQAGQLTCRSRVAAGDGHVLATRRPGQCDRLVDAAGHEHQGRAVLALQGRAGSRVTTKTGARNGGVSPHGIAPPSNIHRPMP
jgi:hypothetical protein